MTQPCMLAYSLLLIKTCHRRGVHAMGGMAAQIPIKNDPKANEAALTKVGHQSMHLPDPNPPLQDPYPPHSGCAILIRFE